MKSFREIAINEKLTMSDVESFVKDMDITNMDFKLNGNIIEISGFMNRSDLNDFDDTMKSEYKRKYSFIKYSDSGNVAHFEVKI